MANSNTFEKNLQEIGALYDKLKNGSLTRDEVQDLTALTRELYERIIVIQYKVFDGSVSTPFVDQVHEPVVEQTTAIHAEPVVSLPVEEVVEETPAFDLSLFDEPAENEAELEIAPEEIIEEVDLHEEAEVEEVPELENSIIEEVEVQEKVEEIEAIVEAPAIEVIETPATPTPTISSNNSLVENLRQLVDPSESQFGMGGLTSLVGSFGLNERLLYINELFGGSSEEFAKAIQHLDTAGDFQNALQQVSAFASQYNWNLNSESVSDFVNKLKRRYA